MFTAAQAPTALHPTTVHASITTLLPKDHDLVCLLRVAGCCEDHLLVMSTGTPEVLIYLVMPDHTADIKAEAVTYFGHACRYFQTFDTTGQDGWTGLETAARWVLDQAMQALREE